MVLIIIVITNDWGAIQAHIHAKPVVAASTEDINTADLLKYTNENRQTPLVLDERLNHSAQAKCKDMVARNYWAHTAPGETDTWQRFIEDQDITQGQAIGENLSFGFSNSRAVVTGWMNSPEHKANIVKPEYSMAGFGVCHSDSYTANKGLPATIVVQHFAG